MTGYTPASSNHKDAIMSAYAILLSSALIFGSTSLHGSAGSANAVGRDPTTAPHVLAKLTCDTVASPHQPGIDMDCHNDRCALQFAGDNGRRIEPTFPQP